MSTIVPQPIMDKPHDPREQDVADYPQTPDSIERAKAAARQERLANGLDPDTGAYYEQWERLADMQTVFAIARKYGGARVQKWIRNYERGGSL